MWGRPSPDQTHLRPLTANAAGGGGPLCFVLPASTTAALEAMHEGLISRVVRRDDTFVNIFPKHQEDIVAHGYPGDVEMLLDPEAYMDRLCSCRAIISSRFHGAVLGLHMGIPTFGAWHTDEDHKVAELMIKAMRLPDQFMLIDEKLTRSQVERRVEEVGREYREGHRRAFIRSVLESFFYDFESQVSHVMTRVLKVDLPHPGVKAAVAARKETGMPPPAMPRFSTRPLVRATRAYLSSTILLGVIVLLVLKRARHKSKGASNGRALFEKTSPWGPPSPEQLQWCAEPAASPDRLKVPTPSSHEAKGLILALDLAVWLSLAVGFTVYSKQYLRETQNPAGLLALQGATGILVPAALGHYGILDHSLREEFYDAVFWGRAGWVGILHAGQVLFTNSALLVCGAAVTNAARAAEAVPVALFSYLLLGRRSTGAKLVAMALMVIGTTMLMSRHGSTGDRGEGDNYAVVAFFVIITALSFNAMRMVVLRMESQLPYRVTLFVFNAAAATVGLGIMLMRFLLARAGAVQGDYGGWFLLSGLNATLCCLGYHFASCNLAGKLSPCGQALGQACRRVLMFASGLLLLGEAVSVKQFVGAVIVNAGALAFDMAGIKW